MMNGDKISWRGLWKTPRTKWGIIFCVISLMIIIFYLPTYYGAVIQPKPGIYLNDVILNLFTPYNWSVLIFTLIYISIAQTIFSLTRYPSLVLLGLTTYFAVSLIRMFTMYMLTLETPLDMILLIDPISALFYPTNTFAKDMFFSGHLSTMSVLVLVEPEKWAKWVKAGFSMVIGILLAWQHVHYTIDLVVAPLVTIGVFYGLGNLLGLRIKV